MRKSKRHEVRQTYNAQAVVDADGSQLDLTGDVVQTNDGPAFEATIDKLCGEVGTPQTVLADAGYANGEQVGNLEARGIEVLVSVSQPGRHEYDFRPPKPERAPGAKPPPQTKAPWRIEMQKKLQTDEAKAKYKKRKCLSLIHI